LESIKYKATKNKLESKNFEHCEGYGYTKTGSFDEKTPQVHTVIFLLEALKRNFLMLEDLNVTLEKYKCNHCNKEFALIQVKNGLETLESLSYDTKASSYIYPRYS
jgi:hypothetical protein